MNRLPADAFEQYVALGSARTYQGLAERLRVSKRSIVRRAVAQDWQGRLARIEAAGRDKLDEKLGETLQAVNGRHLKTLRVIQAKALQALQAMALDSAMDAVRALDVAIRSERLILGEPSDRTAVSIEEVIRREYERWMAPPAVPAAVGATAAPTDEEQDDAEEP